MLIVPVTVPPGERGKWRVSRFVVDAQASKATALRAMFKGRGYLPEGVYTQLTCAGRGIVMSDTPRLGETRSEFDRRRRCEALGC